MVMRRHWKAISTPAPARRSSSKAISKTRKLTVTVDYPTAKAAFVTRDQQEVMQAFLSGKILVDGDASKLLALQSGAPADIDPIAVEMYQKLDAMTAKDG